MKFRVKNLFFISSQFKTNSVLLNSKTVFQSFIWLPQGGTDTADPLPELLSHVASCVMPSLPTSPEQL